MASSTVVDLPRISSTELRALILETATSNVDAQTPPAKLAVVDVRDDDHVGGHIRHSIHAPSSTLDHKVPALVRKLQDKEVVVFHCALSQQRGPSAAQLYVRERQRLLGASGTVLVEGAKTSEEESAKMSTKDSKEGSKEGELEGVEGKKKEQVVYVLDRGFVGWQERYGEDPQLTEGYRKDIWKDGY